MRRTIVLLAAMAAMVVVYAGAALATTVSELEPNDSFAQTQNIDAFFSLDADPNITDSTTLPHATVDATGNGSLDFYSFTVPEAGMGTFDIDGAYPGFDSYLQLFDSTNRLLTDGNDSATTDAGSTECVGDPDCGVQTRDSYLQYNFPSAGTYYIKVVDFQNSAIQAGKSYTLNVSIPNHTLAVEDTISPSGTVQINNGATHTNSTAVTLNPSATDPAPGSGVAQMRFSNNGSTWSAWEAYAITKGWTLSSANGTKTVYAQFRDVAGNVSAAAQDAIVLDTVKPRVSAATPTLTEIGRSANVVATFSEKMSPVSVTNSTFKLFKVTSSGTTQVTNVTVTRSSDGLKATLNPFGTSTTQQLAARTKYKAVVTTGAKDLAGNALDQDPMTAGDQQKTWTFTTKG
jgi:hypothetical protein